MTSLMLKETLEAPSRVAAQLAHDGDAVEDLAGALRQKQPAFAMTVARGSSDHAANFGRYLIETLTGVVTASAAPSVVTVYGAKLALAPGAVIGLSQSGASPDLVAVMDQARQGGALTASLVNVPGSPLAEAAEHVLPLHAGPETSVAATKSFVCGLTALVRLTAAWAGDRALAAALERLPDRLEQAATTDWSAALPVLKDTQSALVVARGRSFAVAQEMALKFKETSALHAEPFSAAEVQHGPMALVEPGFPILVLGIADETLEGVVSLAGALRDKGAHILLASSDKAALRAGTTPLPLPPPLHPVLDPIVAVQAFYAMAAMLAAERGLDPDRPRHLRKVTKTV
ncbi:MAG: SIS domain-containing protein [Inquilinaceae bacterium]